MRLLLFAFICDLYNKIHVWELFHLFALRRRATWFVCFTCILYGWHLFVQFVKTHTFYLACSFDIVFIHLIRENTCGKIIVDLTTINHTYTHIKPLLFEETKMEEMNICDNLIKLCSAFRLTSDTHKTLFISFVFAVSKLVYFHSN